MLTLSVILSLLAVGATTYTVLTFDETVTWLTILCVWPLFAIVAAISLIYAPLQFTRGKRRAALPLLVCLIAAAMTYGVLRVSWSTDVKFDLHVAGFNEVLRQIEAGALQPDEHDNVHLPSQYQYLSESGKIRLHQKNGVTSVLFYGSIGILGEFWSYAYRSDNNPPPHFLWCDDWRPLRSPRPNWFVCISD